MMRKQTGRNSRRGPQRTKPKRSSPRRPSARETDKSICPIVGVGGSAGGFEATMELLRNLPPKNEMAFVIVQHLDPHHASRLASLLRKATTMPVIELRARTKPLPNTVYVQPPDKCVIVNNGALELIRRTERLNLAIDHFFESLAEHCGSRAIGIVLSGMGSDGTAGLRAIKAAGGLTFAQTLESAKFDAMPRSAIRSGFVDAILPPHELAREISRIAKHPYLRRPDGTNEEEMAYRQADDLGRIFISLKNETGVDFSSYKQATLLRRIQRRMALHRLDTVSRYAKFLRHDKKEIQALFDDLLINVTRFFRDEPVFRALKKKFLPAILKKKRKDRRPELRAWVPGCATGEEVYSLAICVLEVLGPEATRMRIQIFGTDLSESIIDAARAGIYSSTIEKDVSRARLKRFFTKRDGTYRINRAVRDICTFARQNIVADPPFSKLDLISCRNVLIYLGPDLHKRCIPQFHYALKSAGYLILGPAESIGGFDALFTIVDKKNKIYARKNVPTPHHADFQPYQGTLFRQGAAKPAYADSATFGGQIMHMADRIMLSTYAPAAVVIDPEMQVHQFRGRSEIYLQQLPGPATHNLLQLARPSLVADLRAIIRQAIKTEKPVRKEGALVKLNGANREINIQVVPFSIPESKKPWLLVIFDETTTETKPGKILRLTGKTATQAELVDLRRELSANRESLQAIIEEQEATNEELKAANEEIESSNEELQSTNEELETAKEELQSTNEELTTLNEELSNRNLEMMQMNSDLNNLLASIRLPIVMVDNNLKVRRATPAARSAFNILQTDAGRPITDFKPNIDVPDLDDLLREVIETLAVRERKVTDKDGRRYSLRVRPYRTSESKIDGAVITLVDIDGKGESNSVPLPTRKTKRKQVDS